MNKILLFVAALLVLTTCISEIKMNHRHRNAYEAKMFIEYMNNGPAIQAMMKTLSSLFPHK